MSVGVGVGMGMDMVMSMSMGMGMSMSMSVGMHVGMTMRASVKNSFSNHIIIFLLFILFSIIIRKRVAEPARPDARELV
jgi:Na+-driven multidrug efflux pump